MVHCVDIFATVLELAGIDLSKFLGESRDIDSRSLLPVMRGQYTGFETVLCEAFGGDVANPGKAFRNERFKLIRYDSGAEEFYDLESDVNEESNLLDETLISVEQANYDSLVAGLNDLTSQ